MNPSTTLASTLNLHPCIADVLTRRGLGDPQTAGAFLNPLLDHLTSPQAFSQMQIAVERILAAIRAEQPIAIYADRDVDGLSGLAILARTLRSLGGTVVWGSPMKGRGVEREVLERLVRQVTCPSSPAVVSGGSMDSPPVTGGNDKRGVMVLVDCGTAEHTELSWLASQGIDTIVADHHRFGDSKPEAFAWIHPGVLENSDEVPAGCVMAFKLAQAIWISFLGNDDPERMDYFLFSHLDLISLGILADRMPLKGENRILVWHGLRRLAYSRKAGIAALTRFFRLTPRSGPLTVREVTWQLIPILNAGGRLGRPDLTAELLITEDSDTARDCIDQLLRLNTQRRAAQDDSLASFEKAVLEQCAIETDPVIIALAKDLEPSVTGLAAQSLVRKYNRPAFLFVDQGEQSVGSGRGLPGIDLFAWVEAHQDCLVKFGGHQGAVGMTIRTADFEMFRGRLLKQAKETVLPVRTIDHADVAAEIEAVIQMDALDEFWWMSLGRLAPFGTGHPLPLFQLEKITSISPVLRKRSKAPVDEFILKCGEKELKAEFDLERLAPAALQLMQELSVRECAGPWTIAGYPVAVRHSEREFTWMIRNLERK